MERLTERNPSWIDDELWESACEPDCEEVDSVYRRLKEYEDLEEQDRLFILPCKPGDTVYYINPDKTTINELVVYGFDIRPLQRFVYDYMGVRLNFNQFGKTAFFIKAEAKKRLKELQNKKG